MNIHSKWINGLLIFIIMVMFSLSSVSTVHAYEEDNDGRVSSDEIINDDLLLSGDHVVMNGKVMGNLIAGGQDVVINGFVEGDAFVFGQNVTIGQGAQIKGNLFTGAQTVVVSGKTLGSLFSGSMATSLKSTAVVERNLYFGGYSLDVAEGATINKDLAAGGYQVILDGKVDRDVNADVGAFQLNGVVGRNFNVAVGEPGQSSSGPASTPFMPQSNIPRTLDTGLYIAESATIGGDLAYTSIVPQKNSILAEPSGEIIYKTPVPDKQTKSVDTTSPQYRIKHFFEEGIGKRIINTIRDFISLFLLGALALWLVPGIVTAVTEKLKSRPLPSLGYGALFYLAGWFGTFVAFLVLIAVAVLAGVLTLGGLGTAVFWTGSAVLLAFLIAFILLITFGSQILVSTLAGNWILTQFTHKVENNKFAALLIGVVIYVLIKAIPVLGWLISFVVVLCGLGAIWMYLSSLRKPASVTVIAQ